MRLHNLFGMALLRYCSHCFTTSALTTDPSRKGKYAFSGFLSGVIGIFFVFASCLTGSEDEDKP
jgi:hypothetical protein